MFVFVNSPKIPQGFKICSVTMPLGTAEILLDLPSELFSLLSLCNYWFYLQFYFLSCSAFSLKSIKLYQFFSLSICLISLFLCLYFILPLLLIVCFSFFLNNIQMSFLMCSKSFCLWTELSAYSLCLLINLNFIFILLCASYNYYYLFYCFSCFCKTLF